MPTNSYDDWNLIEERDVNDNLLVSYVHGEKTDEIICRRVPGNTIYYHHDALGNVALLTDDSGQLIEHYTYDAFGKPTILNATNGIIQTSAYGNRFLFTGREYLPRLSLYDYRNRVYSPELGRFLQMDPIRFGFQQNKQLASIVNAIVIPANKKRLQIEDINIYRYTANNPVNKIDPNGLWCIGERTCDFIGEATMGPIKICYYSCIGLDNGIGDSCKAAHSFTLYIICPMSCPGSFTGWGVW